VCVCVCVCVCVLPVARRVMQCDGPSMTPTLNGDGQTLLYEAISVRRRALQRGDVVLAIAPYDCNRNIVKRIVAMGGDTVRVDDFWHGHKFITVPTGHVWLQGDNLPNSNDSRHYGAVPLGVIYGRVFHVLFPWAPISRTLQYAGTTLNPDVPPADISTAPPV
jgi:inner membrane protease subunit 1